MKLKALTRRQLKQGLFIALILGGLGLAFPVFNIFSKQLSMDNHENRLLTTLPDVFRQPIGKLPDALNTFLADNSPFRYQLVLANANLNYRVFGTIESDQVLLGKEGWLFYKDGPNAATPVANYQGLVRMEEAQLARLAQDLQSLYDECAERGIRLVVSFAPSKDIIYSEYMPDEYPVVVPFDLTDQVASYLWEATTVPVCYNTDDFFENKRHAPLYFKTDTHWNHTGALIALDQILRAVEAETNRFVDYDIQKQGSQTGDMANVAALYNLFPQEDDYFPLNYSYPLDKRTVLVYGDSFSEYYMPYLNQRFTSCWRDALENLNARTLPDAGADIVIIEANERSFETLCQVLRTE